MNHPTSALSPLPCIPIRHAIRALMLTPDGRVLLIQTLDKSRDFRVWFAPGGGLEPGESPHDCLRREIQEETGLTLTDIGPHVWRREHRFTWEDREFHQAEDFYLVRTEPFEPDARLNPDGFEHRAFQQFRWWSVAEINASDEVFAPRVLGQRLQEIIDRGPPGEVIDVGV